MAMIYEPMTSYVKTSQFYWNSAPIGGTDIFQSVAAVGREFRFSLDVELSMLPELSN